tara:strand:+ start:2033 stop:2374 length:342 start_codon:yes stop_codon:yes gene_type:complete
MNIEESNIEDGFVTFFDDDGLVTIQMSLESCRSIVVTFGDNIKSKTDKTDILYVKEFGNRLPLEFTLKNDKSEDTFSLTAINTDSTNLYHDFELEECDLETWYKFTRLIYHNN